MSETRSGSGGNESKSAFNLPWANIVALLAAAGGIFSLIPGLSTSRPPDPGGQRMGVFGDQTVDSRLWQDPFEEAQKDAEKKESAARPEHSFENLKKRIDEAPNDIWAIIVLVPSGPHADPRERRLRTRTAVVEGLSSSGFAPRDSGHIGYLKERWPLDSHDLNFDLPVQQDVRSASGKAETESASASEVMPFEWFDRMGADRLGEAKQVVVLWVQEDACKDAPFTRLAWVSRQLGLANDGWKTAERRVRATVLGPSTSTLLERMVHEAQRMNETSRRVALDDHLSQDLGKYQAAQVHDDFVRDELRGVSLFCPTATASDGALLPKEVTKAKLDFREWRATYRDEQKEWARMDPGYKFKEPAENLSDQIEIVINKALAKDGLAKPSFKRTIATDGELIWETIKELQRRGIHPKEWVDDPNLPNVSRLAANEDEGKNAIAVISELDTFYGRALPATFREQCTHKDFSTVISETGVEPDPWIYNFQYLRGLDGRLPGDAAEKKSSDSSSKEEQKQTPDARPDGHDQTDYLLRIAEVIQTEDQRRRDAGRQGFRAIGVLGSDVYDKLLILRALRPKFPGILFFTNNMEAQLAQPEEWKAAHNLVVVSAFGLQLHPRFQRHVPPFRDSYQTAFYLATLIAAGQLEAEQNSAYSLDKLHDLMQPPRVFEIGRNGALDISADVVWRPDGTRSNWPLSDYDEKGAAIPRIHPLRTDLKQWWSMSHWTLLGRWPLRGKWTRLQTLPVPLSIFLALLVSGALAFVFYAGAVWVRTQAVPSWADHWPTPGLLARLQRWYPPERLGAKHFHRICGMVQGGVWNFLNEWFPFSMLLAAVLAALAAVLMVTVAYHSQWIEGEPFAWFGGLSIWPGVAIRIFAIVLAVHFVLRSYFQVGRSDQDILDRFSLGSDASHCAAYGNQDQIWRQSFLPWTVEMTIEKEPSPPDVPAPGEAAKSGAEASDGIKPAQATATAPNREISFDARKMWCQYIWRGWWQYRLVRVGVWVLLYVLASFFVLAAFDSGFPSAPVRGSIADPFPIAKYFDQGSMLALSIASIFLTLFVVDALRLNISFIRVFSSGRTIWPKEVIQRSGRTGILGDHEIAEGLDIHLLAKRTADIGELVLYPFYIAALLAVSRAPYFDDWGWTTGMIVVLGAQLALAAFSGLSMRWAAENARADALRELRKSRALASAGSTPECAKKVQMLDEVIGEIKDLEEGAFAPLSSQPVIRALLYPAGGVGLWELARKVLLQS